MSGVLSELSKYLAFPFDEVLDYKYTVVSNNVINITGYKKILSYSMESITFSVKKNQLIVEGKNLKIKELDKGNLVLTGSIQKIYLNKEIDYV